MTTIGPKLEQLMNTVTADKVITKKEAEQIQNQLKQEVESGNVTPEEATEFVQSRLKDTNATISFKSEKINNINVFNFKIAGASKVAPDIKVTDFQKRAETDAKDNKDIQYKALSRYPQNFISYNKETGDITGSQLVKNGEKRTGADGKLVTSQGPNPTTFKKVEDLILSDFSRYADPPLSKTFPQASGLNDLTNALKDLKGNSNNPNIKDENVKELLSYINTGKNTSGKSDVKQLQGLLSNLTGNTGSLISDKNNPPGGDDKYGYATTLQVRSLAANLRNENFETSIEAKKEIPPPPEKYSKVFVFIDNSASTEKMRAQQTKNLEENIKNDPAWKNVKQEKISFGNEKGSMQESVIVAASKKLDNTIKDMKPGEKVLLTAFVDTNDSTSLKEFRDLKQKIADAKQEGKYIDFKITFGNIPFDLDDVKEDVFKNKTAGAPVENLEWIKVVDDKLQKMPAKDFLSSISLMERSSSVPIDTRNQITEKMLQLSKDDFKALKSDKNIASSFVNEINFVNNKKEAWDQMKASDVSTVLRDILTNSKKIGKSLPDDLAAELEKKMPKQSKNELEAIIKMINANKTAYPELKREIMAIVQKNL